MFFDRFSQVEKRGICKKRKTNKIIYIYIIVPELVTKLPIEQFRGYPSLKEKDKKRIQQVIEKGVGATWNDVKERPLPSKEDNELLKQVADDDDNNNKNDKDDKKDDKKNNKNKKKDDKKKRKRDDSNNDDEKDMTAQLTGVTEPLSKKKKTNNKNNKKDEQQQQQPKQPKQEKQEKKKEVEEIKLAKQDQLELENLAKQIRAVTKNL